MVSGTYMARAVRCGLPAARRIHHERITMYETTGASESPQQKFFRVTDNIPEETWYWLALASIGISASLKLANKNDWALFVGQWPPTFILFGLYHRLIRPSTKP
jgi:hypothetical protein